MAAVVAAAEQTAVVVLAGVKVMREGAMIAVGMRKASVSAVVDRTPCVHTELRIPACLHSYGI